MVFIYGFPQRDLNNSQLFRVGLHVYKIEYKNFNKKCSVRFAFLFEIPGPKRILSIG